MSLLVKVLRTLIVLALVIAALVAGGIYLSRPKPVHVTLTTADRGLVESTVANTRAGTVTANLRAKLAPPMGGQVAKLLVKEGDHVQPGQVLLELWNEDLTAQLAVAKAEAQRAQALAEEARLRSEWAERDAKRQEDLAKRDISAEERVDRARSDAEATRATMRAALAQADVQRHQATVIEAQLQRTRLLAPFAGIVAEVNGEVGEFVTPSPVGIPTPPAIDLIDDRVPYVTAPIDEVDAAKVRLGQSARITLDAFGKRSFAGRVRRIAPYVLDREKQARTVDVEVEFVDPPKDAVLLPGYSADVEILLESRENVVRIPTEALREGGKVLVVLADQTLGERVVQTGLANWRTTEITQGLSPGDSLVLTVERAGVELGTEVVVDPPAATGAKSANGKP